MAVLVPQDSRCPFPRMVTFNDYGVLVHLEALSLPVDQIISVICWFG
jgi:hypothetical protein